jgi:syntaxin 18
MLLYVDNFKLSECSIDPGAIATQLNHINTLARMLGNIRKPYLNVDSRNPPLTRQVTRNIDFGGPDQSWAGIRHLTNEERDQIDLQARVILTRCADRVKEMETLEKRADYSSVAF